MEPALRALFKSGARSRSEVRRGQILETPFSHRGDRPTRFIPARLDSTNGSHVTPGWAGSSDLFCGPADRVYRFARGNHDYESGDVVGTRCFMVPSKSVLAGLSGKIHQEGCHDTRNSVAASRRPIALSRDTIATWSGDALGVPALARVPPADRGYLAWFAAGADVSLVRSDRKLGSLLFGTILSGLTFRPALKCPGWPRPMEFEYSGWPSFMSLWWPAVLASGTDQGAAAGLPLDARGGRLGRTGIRSRAHILFRGVSLVLPGPLMSTFTAPLPMIRFPTWPALGFSLLIAILTLF